MFHSEGTVFGGAVIGHEYTRKGIRRKGREVPRRVAGGPTTYRVHAGAAATSCGPSTEESGPVLVDRFGDELGDLCRSAFEHCPEPVPANGRLLAPPADVTVVVILD